jgi:kynurenine formamidase
MSSGAQADTALGGIDMLAPVSLARTLRFDGLDPRHFGAPPPAAPPLRLATFSGAVGTGASCNCRVLTLVPHCHGTHTESVAHLTHEPLDVCTVAPLAPMPAWLVSVRPAGAHETMEDSVPAPQPGDRLLTRAAIEAGWPARNGFAPRALILRSGHGEAADDDLAPYLSRQAVGLLVERGIEHLVVELPSIDRSHDEGVLCGHRQFFGMPPGSRHLGDAARPHCTITEYAAVPATLPDGPCFLQLALPRLAGDAVPSQPVYFPWRGGPA